MLKTLSSIASTSLFWILFPVFLDRLIGTMFSKRDFITNLTQEQKTFLRENTQRKNIINMASFCFFLVVGFGLLVYADTTHFKLPGLFLTEDHTKVKLFILFVTSLFYWPFVISKPIELLVFKENARLMQDYQYMPDMRSLQKTGKIELADIISKTNNKRYFSLKVTVPLFLIITFILFI